jgi:hypothetical protein
MKKSREKIHSDAGRRKEKSAEGGRTRMMRQGQNFIQSKKHDLQTVSKILAHIQADGQS